MPDFSWIPGLPDLGETYDLWFVDPDPKGKSLKNMALVFEVSSSGEGRLLANRYKNSVEIDPETSVTDITQEKRYLKVDGSPRLIKRFKLHRDQSGETKLPDAVVGVELPPAKMEIPTS